MANPRQRRKARSSTYRKVTNSRHARKKAKKTPPIRGSKVLQDNWDNRKTVRQNYAALGLVYGLNPSASGGTELREKSLQAESCSSDGETITNNTPSDTVPHGHGRIIRDEYGHVIGVEIPEDQNADPQAPNEESMPDAQIDENARRKWVNQLGRTDQDQVSRGGSELVSELQRISGEKHSSTTLSIPISGAGVRYASAGERIYLQKLMEKYGKDVERMARDRKLNQNQHTAGELRRALRRAGLLDSLR